MNRLFDLLTELSIDPWKHAAFVADRQDEALTEEERAAIARALSPEAQAAIAGGAWSRCAGLFDPGPDPEEDPDPPELRRRNPHPGRVDRHRAALGFRRPDVGHGGFTRT
jgi:hypothetical protein